MISAQESQKREGAGHEPRGDGAPLSSQLGRFDLWQPMEDSVFIERLEPIEKEQQGTIIKTDMRRDEGKMILRKGRVLAVGPGKWHPGEWWKVVCALEAADFEIDGHPLGNAPRPIYKWQWISGWRETPEVKVGQIVLFNARWNDLAHSELKPIGADLKSRTAPLERPLSYRFDPTIHLVTERDIAGVLHEA